MSDTDDEVVPSSQPVDQSMVSVVASNSKRARLISQLSDVEEQRGSPQAEAARKDLERELSCGICLSIITNPFIVMPCLHSYCRECLGSWWRNQANCPFCKRKSSYAQHNFHLGEIVFLYLKIENRLTQQDLQDQDQASHEDLFPRGRRGLISLPSSMGSTQLQTQSQRFEPLLTLPSSFGDGDVAMAGGSQSQSQRGIQQPLGPPVQTFPGGNLVWPCASCAPGNQTGFICSEPLPMPTPEQIAAEQQAYRPAGPAVRPPGRGENRVDLHAARLNEIPGSFTHNECNGCSTYLPAEWNPPRQKCSDCGTCLCSNYDPQGCPSGSRLLPRNALSSGVVTSQQLWDTCPPTLKGNTEELRRFEAYLRESRVTLDRVLENLVDLKLRNEKSNARHMFPAGEFNGEPSEEVREALEDCDRKWGQGVYLCSDSIYAVASENFLEWWIAERRIRRPRALPSSGSSLGRLTSSFSGRSPGRGAALDDCWHGYECRTQSHNSSHAARFNHICSRNLSHGAA